MLVVRHRCATADPASAKVVLAFGERQQARLRTRTTDGEEVGILLLRGACLADGDRLQADDGRVLEVVAASEPLCDVRCAEARELVRAAYHLGNRHTPVEIGSGFLRFARDEVLAAMVRGLGLEVRDVEAPFQPEPGAYAHDASHRPAHRGVIHDFAGLRDRR